MVNPVRDVVGRTIRIEIGREAMRLRDVRERLIEDPSAVLAIARLEWSNRKLGSVNSARLPGYRQPF